MPSYECMFLIPQDEYKALQSKSSDHDKLIDSISGDLHGSQVNHIEI